MTIIVIFALSGAAIVLLLGAKVLETKSGKTFFILKIISLSDIHLRELSHRSAHFYTESKEKVSLLVRRQLPMRARSFWNKLTAIAQEEMEKNIVRMRDIKLLKSRKQDISEFFRTMDTIEKGGGEINERVEDLIALPPEETQEPQPEPAPTTESAPEPVVETEAKVSKPRRKRVKSTSNEAGHE